MKEKRHVKFNSALIDEYLEKPHMTKKEFCKRCGFSTNTLRQFYAENHNNVRYKTLRGILDVLKVKPKDFMGF